MEIRWAFFWLGIISAALAVERDGETVNQLRADSSISFDIVLEGNAQVIEEFPRHPRSLEVLGRLTQALMDDGHAGGEREARERLIVHFAEHNIGLHLFNLQYTDLATESERRALDYARQVRDDIPDSAVAAMAFSKELDYLAREDPGRFLDTCAAAIDRGQNDRERRIALLRRARFHQLRGEIKQACLDRLRFWALYPEKVESMGLKDSFVSTVKRAGFILEASVLSMAPRPGPFAGALVEEFETAAKSDPSGGENHEPPGPSGAYFLYAPDVEKIQNTEIMDDSAGIEHVLFPARLGRLHHHEDWGPEALHFFREFDQKTRDFLSTAELDSPRLMILAQYADAVIGNSQQMVNEILHSHDLAIQNESQELLKKLRILVERLRVTRLEIEKHNFVAADPQTTEEEAELTESLAVQAKAANRHRKAFKAYQGFIQRYPDSDRSPGFMLKLAEMYDDPWGAPLEAVRICGELIEAYPETQEAVTAQLRQGLYLYEAEQFEDALMAFQCYVTAYPGDAENDVAIYHTALCEAALERKGEAEITMAQLAKDHPDSSLIPAALFWLGDYYKSVSDRDRAQEVFLDLVNRYPATAEAKRAQLRLISLDSTKQRLNEDAQP